MNSDSSASSRASSPDMDDMFLREHHHLPHHHVASSVSSTSNTERHKMTPEHLRSGDSKGSSKYKLKKQVTEEEMYQLRLKINGRERKRMHDLNLAMDGLREVMPYAHGPSVRKLSKIATLLLARNYILMLTSSLDEMKRLVGEIYGGQHSAFHCGTVAGAHSGGHSGGPVAAAVAAAAAAAHQVHPLLSTSASGPLPGSLPGLASMRPPHSLMKGSPLLHPRCHWAQASSTGQDCRAPAPFASLHRTSPSHPAASRGSRPTARTL